MSGIKGRSFGLLRSSGAGVTPKPINLCTGVTFDKLPRLLSIELLAVSIGFSLRQTRRRLEEDEVRVIVIEGSRGPISDKQFVTRNDLITWVERYKL